MKISIQITFYRINMYFNEVVELLLYKLANYFTIIWSV